MRRANRVRISATVTTSAAPMVRCGAWATPASVRYTDEPPMNCLSSETRPKPQVLAARLWRRIPSRFDNPQNRAAIIEAMQIPWLRKTLFHLPEFNLGITYLLRNRRHWPQITSHLLIEIANSNHTAVCHFLDELFRYEDYLRRGLLDPRPMRTITTLLRRHKKLDQQPARPHLPLPQPPLAGGPGIDPISTSAGLLREASEQRNCLGTIAIQRRILDGDIYCYRLMAPVRATILLRLKHETGRWLVEQIKATNNQRVSVEAYWRIGQWLKEASPQKRF